MWSILVGLAWACPEEGLGNNIETATVLSVGSTNASLCSSQVRWYRIMAGEGLLDLTAIFAHAQGDLDLYLYDEASLAEGALPLVASRTATDNEHVVLDRTGLGDLYLKLQWHPIAQEGADYFELTSYGLSLSFSPSDCEEDRGRSFVNAEAAIFGEEGFYSLCPGRDLWFSFSLTHSSTFLARMFYQAADDVQLQMVLWSEAGVVLGLTPENSTEISYSYWGTQQDDAEILDEEDSGARIDTEHDTGAQSPDESDTQDRESARQQGDFFVQIRSLELLSQHVPLSLLVQDTSLNSCEEDDYPEATFVDQAPDLPWGSYALNACATDYFWFENSADAQLWIRAEFETQDGDLDLYLYDEAGTLLEASERYEALEELKVEEQGRFLLKVQLSHDLGEVGVSYMLSVLSQEVDDTEGQGATISIEEEADEQSSSSKDTGCAAAGANQRSLSVLILCSGLVCVSRRRISY